MSKRSTLDGLINKIKNKKPGQKEPIEIVENGVTFLEINEDSNKDPIVISHSSSAKSSPKPVMVTVQKYKDKKREPPKEVLVLEFITLPGTFHLQQYAVYIHTNRNYIYEKTNRTPHRNCKEKRRQSYIAKSIHMECFRSSKYYGCFLKRTNPKGKYTHTT